MRRSVWMAVLWMLLALVLGRAGGALADPLNPRTPDRPPKAPPKAQAQTTASAAVAQPEQRLDLPPLKAVLIVGPIDGDYGAWTTSEKQNMELAAAELEANGVSVQRFYTPQNDWEQIKAAAQGAHFLFYRGHGVYWSPMPSPVVGGFALKDRFVSSDDLRADLELMPNAIVMLYGCFTAGSSSIDDPPIDSAEAQRRVAQYSDPFFDLGAAGYYADWFGDAFQMFVRYLFQGRTLGQAYESFYDFNPSTVERYLHPDHPTLAMWLDKDNWDGWQYNNAFAGRPELTLQDLFGGPRMVLSSTRLDYLAAPAAAWRTFRVNVTSTTEAFEWTATVSPAGLGWLSVSPLSGSSGGQTALTLMPGALPPGEYHASLRVIATDPEVDDGDQTVEVTLFILEGAHSVQLPWVAHP